MTLTLQVNDVSGSPADLSDATARASIRGSGQSLDVATSGSTFVIMSPPDVTLSVEVTKPGFQDVFETVSVSHLPFEQTHPIVLRGIIG